MVHAGPFANIAIGQSSIIADRLGLKMFDYHRNRIRLRPPISCFEEILERNSAASGG